MNILVAPDSFKGSMTAMEAAKAMKEGIHHVYPEANVNLLPMADGGEGTMESLIEATSGTTFEVEAQDALGRVVLGEYGVMGDGKTAVIELATVSGLQHLTVNERNPYITSTYGTGQLILHALDKGFTKFIICLGGSATNDGGVGMLKALGYNFVDALGNELEAGGLALCDLHKIDTSEVKPVVSEASFQVACDVTNPLLGKNGASAIYGPQKGATREMVQALDESLTVFAKYVEHEKQLNLQNKPGVGAAGGTAFGLVAFLNATLKSGIEIVMEHTEFESLLCNKSIDLLITGEGKIDTQTSSGKVISGLVDIASKYDVPTIALAGSVVGNLDILYDKGLTAAFSILQEPLPLVDAMTDGKHLIRKETEQILRLILKIQERNSKGIN